MSDNSNQQLTEICKVRLSVFNQEAISSRITLFILINMPILVIMNLLLQQDVIAQDVYFDHSNKVLSVPIKAKNDTISIIIKGNKNGTVTSAIIKPANIGSAKINNDYSFTNSLVIFDKQDTLRTTSRDLFIDKSAKEGGEIILMLVDTKDTNKVIDNLLVKLNKDNNLDPYEEGNIMISIGTSFAIDTRKQRNNELYTDFRFFKSNLFKVSESVSFAIDAGLANAQSSITEESPTNENSPFYYVMRDNSIIENSVITIVAPINKSLSVNSTSAWIDPSFTIGSDNMFGLGMHLEYRNRVLQQTTSTAFGGKDYVFKTNNRIDTFKTDVSEKINRVICEGVFGISTFYRFNSKSCESFIKASVGYRVQSDNNSLFETDSTNAFDEVSYKLSEKKIGWGVQFRLLEKKFGFKIGGEIRGIGLLRPDFFLFLAKEFNISKLPELF
jgi:hypothetical protein